LIQIIDFLNIRRRPEPAKFFERFLRITPRLREALGAQDWSEEAVRAHLSDMDPGQWPDVLDAREWEALQMGARERVTDTELPHIQELPQVLPSFRLMLPEDALFTDDGMPIPVVITADLQAMAD
jgi:hypothetical protein